MLAQRRLGLRTQLAKASEASVTIQLPGRVTVDPNASGRVQTVVGGRLEAGPDGLPVAGQPVRRGQVLGYVVHHPEPLTLASQRALLAEIRGNRKLAEQRLARLQMLEGTVPRKEIDAAKAELSSFRAREAAVAPSLQMREPLVAPVEGVIARTYAVAGQVVESKDVLFEVVDPGRLLVEATTSDPELIAHLADAQLQDIAGLSLRLIGAARSLRDGVLPLTFALNAIESKPIPLAVGQPVTVLAVLDKRIPGIVLPARAITRNASNEPVVWIKASAERYLAQPVAFQSLDARSVVVTQGLGPDNRVVVEGAALIAQIR